MQKWLKMILIKGVIFFTPFISFSQNWATAGDSCRGLGVTLYEDTVMNRVYCGGNFENYGCNWGYTQGNIMPCYDFAYYDGTEWFAQGDTIPMGYDQRVVVRYNGDLFGNIFYANYNSNGSITYIGKWNGTYWERNDTVTGGILSFLVFNKRLYVFGEFTKINNVTAHNVAYKDSLGWHAIDTTTWTGNNTFANGAIYNGDLYISGSFASWDGSIKNFARWDGSQWHNVGGNLFSGTYDFIEALCVYKGYLYVGGAFGVTNSLPGNSITRWNGSQWEQLGTGLTDSAGFSGAVHDMKIINGKLVMAGGFAFAAGLPATAIVEFDGNQFCSFGGNFDNAIYNIAGYNGEILISGIGHIYDISTNDTIFACNKIARWVGGSYRQGCSGNVLNGIAKITKENTYIIYPNPNNGSFIIRGNIPANSNIQIMNGIGQLVYSVKQEHTLSETTINLANLQQGIYILSIIKEDGILSQKITVFK